MDLPQPPQDTELRNIIDKLAQFVARNGPEFEQMTKNKQKGNPKFQFLYGGEYYAYYQYKVNAEQTVIKQQGIIMPQQSQNSNWPNNSNGVNDLEQINQQIEALKEQIKQSEQNLQAQHTVLLQQQQVQMENVIFESQTTDLQKEAGECNVHIEELQQILQPIVESCTKDSIQTGKSWILSHATNKPQAFCIANCLLLKAMQPGASFLQRLHVIYLVNDVLHHCARKSAIDLKDALESVVVAMFCGASTTATEDQKLKLDKLLQLWESKANYLAKSTVEALRKPQESLQQHFNQQIAKYGGEITRVTQATFEGYRVQHQVFVGHATQNIQDLEQRRTNILEEQQRLEQQNQIQQQQIQQIQIPPQIPPPTIQQPPPPININPSIPPPQFNQPPPGYFPAAGMFPDFSKPPPGFPITNPEPPQQEELMPSVPYYELPAGLMVPLIKLEDTAFKPLDPTLIRLPPPAPPSDRLLAAVEAFYAPPSHERPRDSEGWEKLGLYEYYKAKNNAKKEKEDQIEAGLREKSRSPSPVYIIIEKSPSPPKRRYTSRSPTPPRRSRSPRSPKRRRSRSSRSSRRTRSKSPPRSRSPSPLVSTPVVISSTTHHQLEQLDSSNKGHQMLRKMGWGGSGLGVNEQGIDSPISGGDVRDRQDQFKGVGCSLNDPYENFRKNKGAAFITRMKARAEERAQESM
ncbi:calcium homeostasis endoplasmic reticulum protein [Onthophagus taurus]|uniref:calcium homeostasis endoplasmic reticulum protein n=1 Tax=Onthophagus taurus TaxID=166361 RepID=UPI0039BE8030